MDKATFVDILTHIVAGFEDPDFRQRYAEAKARGDVQRLMDLAMGAQRAAFGRHGLDDVTGAVQFKEAGRTYGLDPEVAPLLARMKASLGK